MADHLDLFSFEKKVKNSFSKIKHEIQDHEKKLKEITNENKELKTTLDLLLSEVKELKTTLLSKYESLDLKADDSINFKNSLKQKKQIKDLEHVIISKILMELSKGETELNVLKTKIVDIENLCSKATFYRYINQLNKRGNVLKYKKGRRSYLLLNREEKKMA